jgi:hypothetical protein
MYEHEPYLSAGRRTGELLKRLEGSFGGAGDHRLLHIKLPL